MNFFRAMSYSVILSGVFLTGAIAQTGASSGEVSDEDMSQQVESFKQTIASMEDEANSARLTLAETQAELGTARVDLEEIQQRVSSLRTEEADLKLRLEGLKAEIEAGFAEKAKVSDEITKLHEVALGLEEEIAALKAAPDSTPLPSDDNTAEARSELEALNAQKAAAADALDTLAAQRQEEEATLADVKDKIAAAQAQLDQMNATAASAVTAAPAPQIVSAPDTNTPFRDDISSPAQIRSALLAAPGLNEVADVQMAELERLLSIGICAPDALQAVLGSVNRQTLVSLIRSLGRC